MPTSNSAPTEFRADAFAACLIRLREDARLSQRGLARVAEVSHSLIAGLEREDGNPPHPTIVRKLARGLATSGTGRVDGHRMDALYLDLMHAAGYLPERGPSPDDVFRDRLALYLGDGPRSAYVLGKLKGRSQRTKDSALTILEALADSD